MDEDQEHESDAELPAPEQRVGAYGDEDPEELQEDEAELDREPDQRRDRGPDLAKDPPPVGAPRLDRLVVAPRLSHRVEQRPLLLDREILEPALDIVVAHAANGSG